MSCVGADLFGDTSTDLRSRYVVFLYRAFLFVKKARGGQKSHVVSTLADVTHRSEAAMLTNRITAGSYCPDHLASFVKKKKEAGWMGFLIVPVVAG